MRSVHENNVTAAAEPAPDAPAARSSGIWTIAEDRLILADGDAPATILVPSESVRLLAVELPLKSRAKRLQALPYAIEERIAERSDSVHLALGEAIAPNTYLVGVVSRAQIERWIAVALEAGLDHAAMVPDALALPVPQAGQWSVDLAANRAVVRVADGTGFALAAPMLRSAWERAGRPECLAYGDPLPTEMAAAEIAPVGESRVERLARPALDLRQGAYAVRRASRGMPHWGRRLGWIVGIGAAAHMVIAAADAAMLRAIAERRENDTRALVAMMAPGVTLAEDAPVATRVADLIPPPPGNGQFLPLVARVSGALAPLGPTISMRSMTFSGDRLVMDLDAGDGTLVSRIDSALRSAAVRATVSQAADGSIRIAASAA